MVTKSNPKIILINVPKCTKIDHAATGKVAKAFRESKRITLDEVAEKIKTPRGVKMSKANLSYYEAGSQCWSTKLFGDYVNAVNEAAAGI